MAPDMHRLADDLAAETAVLRALLAPLDDAGWDAPTPAEGWAVRDQVSHLAHFDAAAVQSATEPDAFRAALAELTGSGIDPDAIAAGYRGLEPSALIAWFDDARERLVAVFRDLDPGVRVPWYGPPMSAASSLTARIMETWAHGQDVADTVGVTREPTGRLRHVAHIGVRALPFSYLLRDRPVPEVPVRVELTAPSGQTWEWGPEDAADRVTGPALDFCLLVTQRRHRDDTALRITGPVATEWLTIAQAFAGVPGGGRKPLTT
ncbi:TIGR03084 family metal-binding protein [Pseudonocardia abyssalis]|uniref:TIGR03084 family protein n=1 Tax=Pseudonocardia abyssalis TaxID=2792008 RepID=A0ABS6UV45_9PSEU|nr:TIGR03084 family metal-binding protein [Pseudonocardia abyssalis]MBW0114976.1 TIGR03084 family protein [Pseudonocardia abyssalis]MBW0136116.1 TIGR03084 family protein [Pseudonocardia abyssalis]